MKVVKHINFKVEVNEFAWDTTSSVLLITTISGLIYVLNGKKLHNTPLAKLEAHTGPVFCIAVDPLGKYIATGAADALVCLWDVNEFAPLNTFNQLDWQLRQLSFSHDAKYLATASEDFVIQIFSVQNTNSVHSIKCKAPQHTVAWNPKKYILAYAGEEKSKPPADDGSIHLIKFS